MLKLTLISEAIKGKEVFDYENQVILKKVEY